jgi:hypothetical protein
MQDAGCRKNYSEEVTVPENYADLDQFVVAKNISLHLVSCILPLFF